MLNASLFYTGFLLISVVLTGIMAAALVSIAISLRKKEK